MPLALPTPSAAGPGRHQAAWRSCAPARPAFWIARSRSPRPWRCAATARRAARPAPAPLRSRHDLAFAAAALAIAALAIAARAAGRCSVLRLPGAPRAGWAWRGAVRRRAAARRAAAVPGSPGDRRHERARARPGQLSLSRRRAPGAARGQPRAAAPGSSSSSPGASGSGKSTLLGVASGLVPHFHGGEFAGRGRRGRPGHPHARPRRTGRRGRHPVPGSRDPGADGHARGRARLPAREPGPAPAAIARAVQEAALSLGVAHLLKRSTAELSGGELQRVALGAALAGPPGAARPRRADLAARPGGRGRAAGHPAPAQRGPRHHDPHVRAPARALPGRGRPGARARRRAAGLRRAARRLPGLGGRSTRPSSQTPGARLLHGLGLRPGGRGQAGPGRVCGRAGWLPEPAQPWSSDPAPARSPRRAAHRPAPAPPLARDQRRGATILRGVSLDLAAGERVALMGANGAGQIDAAAPRRRADAADARSRPGRAGASRCCCRTRPTISSTTPSPRRRRPRRCKPSGSGRSSPRAIRASCRGASASGWPSPSCSAIRPSRPPCCAWTSRREGWIAATAMILSQLVLSLGCAALVATHDPEFVAGFAERVVLLAGGRGGRRRAGARSARGRRLLQPPRWRASSTGAR